jgi:6-phosphofructokinase 1
MSIHHQNSLFTHSGGATAVVNSIAYEIYQNTLRHPGKLYISQYGIDGILQSNFIDTDNIVTPEWQRIQQSPGSCFGSSRTSLPSKLSDFEPIFKTFDDLKIGKFFCNGGNNSQLVNLQMFQAAKKLQYPLQCIGIPKTIDNDILHTDTCPGFGSAAKYTATAISDISMDLQAMCQSSTQVIIYEAMGRDAGWLAASSALAKTNDSNGPHIILLPEACFSLKDIITHTKKMLSKHKHCIIVMAEGATDKDNLLSKQRYKSIFLSEYIHKKLKIKCRAVMPDYLQRCSGTLISKVDLEQAKALAHAAFNLALEGQNGIMSTIVRESTDPYHWSVSSIELTKIAGKVKMMPDSYLRQDNLFVSDECIQFLKPLIFGEQLPSFRSGIPNYMPLITSLTQQLQE